MQSHFAEFVSLVARSLPFLPKSQFVRIAEHAIATVVKEHEINCHTREDKLLSFTTVKATILDCIEWWAAKPLSLDREFALSHLNHALYMLQCAQPVVPSRYVEDPTLAKLEAEAETWAPKNIGWRDHSSLDTVLFGIWAHQKRRTKSE